MTPSPGSPPGSPTCADSFIVDPARVLTACGPAILIDGAWLAPAYSEESVHCMRAAKSFCAAATQRSAVQFSTSLPLLPTSLSTSTHRSGLVLFCFLRPPQPPMLPSLGSCRPVVRRLLKNYITTFRQEVILLQGLAPAAGVFSGSPKMSSWSRPPNVVWPSSHERYKLRGSRSGHLL